MPTRNEGRRVSGREGGLILEWSASSRVGGRSRDVDVARQRRERVREKEKHHLPANITLDTGMRCI